MAGPIMEALKIALAKFIENDGIDKLIALILSLRAKDTEEVMASASPEEAEIITLLQQVQDAA